MKRLLCHTLVWLAVAMITGCASRDDALCGGAFKSQADLERVHGKQPPASPSATTSY